MYSSVRLYRIVFIILSIIVYCRLGLIIDTNISVNCKGTYLSSYDSLSPAMGSNTIAEQYWMFEENSRGLLRQVRNSIFRAHIIRFSWK